MGAHKVCNTIGQALRPRHGQAAVIRKLVLVNMLQPPPLRRGWGWCDVYMGAKMFSGKVLMCIKKLMGANVIPVTSGSKHQRCHE